MDRYRSQISPGSPGRHIVWNDGVKTTDSPVTTMNREVRTMNDVLVPDFYKRRAAGEIFNNSYSSTHVTNSGSVNYSNVATSQTVPPKVNQAYWTNCDMETVLGAFSAPLISLDTVNMFAQAKQECLARVNKTEFDLGTFAGEWYQTKRLHRDVGNALLKLLKSPKQKVVKATTKKLMVYDAYGNPVLNRKGLPVYRYSKTARSVVGEGELSKVKDISNAWLVARYGIAPLLGDLENAVKFLSRSPALRKTARSFGVVTGTSTALRSVGDTPGDWHCQYDRVKTIQVRYGILYDTAAFAAGISALGISRPLSTMWELVPYSFVVDWFFRVGLLLDAVQPALASKTLCAWESVQTTETSTGSVLGLTPKTTPGWSLVSSCSGGFSSVSISKSRSRWDMSIPFVPVLGSGFTNLRCGDFAALVLQKLHTRL